MLGSDSATFSWLIDRTRQEHNARTTHYFRSFQISYGTNNKILNLIDSPGGKQFHSQSVAHFYSEFAVLIVEPSIKWLDEQMAPGSSLIDCILSIYGFGVRDLVVAVNKMDQAGYLEKDYKPLVKQLLAMLKKYGFREEQVKFVPVSSFEGVNLHPSRALPQQLKCWYKGKSLLEVIAEFDPIFRPLDLPLRMTVFSTEKISGVGTVLCCRIETGTIAVGQSFRARPSDIPSTTGQVVKSIQTDREFDHEFGVPGNFVGINVAGFRHRDFIRGMIVNEMNSYFTPIVSEFRAAVNIVQSTSAKIAAGNWLFLMIHTERLGAQVTKIDSRISITTGEEVEHEPKAAVCGNAYMMSFKLCRPICLETYADCRPLGRLVIRDSSRVVGYGTVRSIISTSSKEKKKVRKH